ncbi:MAG: hypothetical protein ACLQGT_10735, partial [Terracidiphilus sp.]
LNFSAPSTLIIHPQLARSNRFRLILRWNQLLRSGSSCVGQECGLQGWPKRAKIKVARLFVAFCFY